MRIIEKYKDDIMYFKIKDFEFENRFNHVFSSRIGWNQKDIFKDMSNIMEVREENIFRAKQVHGSDVLIIDNQSLKDISKEEKDGFVTNRKGIVLATYHADCVPVYFYDRKKDVIGLAHAGWKGTLNNICGSIIEAMVEKFESRAEDIIVAIGPSIGICCYEIGPDLVKLFSDKYPKEKDIILEKESKVYLDLWKVNKINLLNLGVKEENIYYSNTCTSCKVDKLYSYRKEKGTNNRMIAAIGLKKRME